MEVNHEGECIQHIQSPSAHLESLLLQLVGCSQEIGSERMLGRRENKRL